MFVQYTWLYLANCWQKSSRGDFCLLSFLHHSWLVKIILKKGLKNDPIFSELLPPLSSWPQVLGIGETNVVKKRKERLPFLISSPLAYRLKMGRFIECGDTNPNHHSWPPPEGGVELITLPCWLVIFRLGDRAGYCFWKIKKKPLSVACFFIH